MSFKKHIAGNIWTALTVGKQKTTGTEVITSLKGKYNIKKKKKKSWKDHVDTSHESYKKEYEGL